MASVVINTRFNNRKAEADLKELQAKAKETAREINAVEKGLGSATTKRNKLRDDLEAARQKAAETAAALDEVNARLDAGRKSKFGVTSKGDETLSDKLAAKLQQQDTAVQAAADAYHAQDAAVQALQQRHAELTAQLAQEKDETTRQAEAVANAAQAAQAAQVDVSNVQRAANAMDAFVSKLFNAASVSKILKRSLSAIGSIGGKAFDFVKSKAQSVQERLAQAAQSTEHLRKRLAGLVSGALVFNVLSSGLRTLTNWMGTALLSSSSLRTALGNLQGAAATAAAPIIQILTPALTALANAAAMVFSYIARLVAFFTGRTISASAGAAKAMNGVGSAAGSAAKKVNLIVLRAVHQMRRLDDQILDAVGYGTVQRLLHVVDFLAVTSLHMVDDDLGGKGAANAPIGVCGLQGILNALDVRRTAAVEGGAEADDQQLILADVICVAGIIQRSITGITAEVVGIGVLALYHLLLGVGQGIPGSLGGLALGIGVGAALLHIDGVDQIGAVLGGHFVCISLVCGLFCIFCGAFCGAFAGDGARGSAVSARGGAAAADQQGGGQCCGHGDGGSFSVGDPSHVFLLPFLV